MLEEEEQIAETLAVPLFENNFVFKSSALQAVLFQKLSRNQYLGHVIL